MYILLEIVYRVQGKIIFRQHIYIFNKHWGIYFGDLKVIKFLTEIIHILIEEDGSVDQQLGCKVTVDVCIKC